MSSSQARAFLLNNGRPDSMLKLKLTVKPSESVYMHIDIIR
mgnify:CR=1 FL=1